jgi:hypothetical protein
MCSLWVFDFFAFLLFLLFFCFFFFPLALPFYSKLCNASASAARGPQVRALVSTVAARSSNNRWS